MHNWEPLTFYVSFVKTKLSAYLKIGVKTNWHSNGYHKILNYSAVLGPYNPFSLFPSHETDEWCVNKSVHVLQQW